MGLNFEFLYVIQNWGDCIGTTERTLVVHTVKHEKVTAIRLAVHGRIRECANRIRPYPTGAAVLRNVDRDNTGSQSEQLGEVAAVERQVIQFFPDDSDAQLRSRCFKGGGGGLDRYGLFD